jgi:hypothetical protein
MTPEQLINEKQILTQSNHTLFDQFHVSNSRLKLLADYASYRKGGVRCGKPLNALEAFAMDILENHADALEFDRTLRRALGR